MMRIFTILSLATVIIAFLFIVMNPKRDQNSSKADIGGKFSLTSHQAKPIAHTDLIGQPTLVYFGFTYCPDICPAGLLTISTALTQLKDSAPQALFISLDPERDTVENLAPYMANFPGVTGLTGSMEQIKQAAKAYRVYYRKVDDEASGDYLIDHSGYIYLMDTQGNYVTHFPHDITVDTLVKGIQKTISPGTSS